MMKCKACGRPDIPEGKNHWCTAMARTVAANEDTLLVSMEAPADADGQEGAASNVGDHDEN